MGPSVKFVSRIIGSFYKKNYGSIFYSQQHQNGGGGRGGRGRFGKSQDFLRDFFFETFPKERFIAACCQHL